MIKIKKWGLIVFLCVIAPPVFSQTGQVKQWSLQECIEYALKNNLQVKQSELNVLSSQIDLKQSKYNRLPSLNANTQISNSVGRSINPFTNVIEDTDLNAQSIGLSSSVTLFNYFSIHNTIKQSKLNLEKSEYDLEDMKNLTTLNIITFYTNILLNTEQVKNAKLTLESTQLQLDKTQKQVEAGALANQSLLQSQQLLATDELNLINAENALALAKLSLKQALQLPAGEEIEIVDPGLSDPEVTIPAESPEGIYGVALTEQPNIKSADTQVESAKYGVEIAKAGLWPTLTLNAGVNTNYSSAAPEFLPRNSEQVDFLSTIGYVNNEVTMPVIDTVTLSLPVEVDENTYFNQLDFNQSRFISLSLSIPIFNKFQGRSNIRRARVSLDNAEIIAQQERNSLRQNIEQAYIDVKAASRSYIATKKQAETLEESFKNVSKRRDLGAADNVEYNQVKNDFDRAKSDLIRTKYDYIFKLKILDFYQNKPLDF